MPKRKSAKAVVRQPTLSSLKSSEVIRPPGRKYSAPTFAIPTGFVLLFEALKIFSDSSGRTWPVVPDVFLRSRRQGGSFEVRKITTVGQSIDYKKIELPCDPKELDSILAARALVKSYFQRLVDGIHRGHISPLHATKLRGSVELEKKHFSCISLQYFTLLGTGTLEINYGDETHSGLLLLPRTEIENLAKRSIEEPRRNGTASDREKDLIEDALNAAWKLWCERYPEFKTKKPLGLGIQIDEIIDSEGDEIRRHLCKVSGESLPMSMTALRTSIRTIAKESAENGRPRLLPGPGEKKVHIVKHTGELTQIFIDNLLSFHTLKTTEDDSED